MYTSLLLAHSWLRWVVLLLGLALLAMAWSGWRDREEWGERANRLRVGFLVALDTQLLVGLTLYSALSPIPRSGLGDLAVALGDAQLRFYTIEHAFGMLVGATVAHVGLARSTRLEGVGQHRATTVTVLLWMLVTAASIPWPGLPYGRPLLRIG